MKVINQREIYLKKLKEETRSFWLKVVEDYNSGMKPDDIAKKYINKRTGKPYSRPHIHSIIKQMRDN